MKIIYIWFFKAEGRSYNFLVRAVNDLGDSPDLVTEEPVVAKNPFDPPGINNDNIINNFLHS